MASAALRRALLLATACYVSASACTIARGDVHGVVGLEPRRYAGVWYQQAAWGTGARAMSWYVSCCLRMRCAEAQQRAVRMSHRSKEARRTELTKRLRHHGVRGADTMRARAV